ncbi:hypothetical protein OnM2_011012 [Erysiphe neolycopersici]|uniref:Uncharacterized protein n=1 Tax=Erysiphe neolycopersici TaxID=212602 RepID=A0A420I6D2_9PEZI|nr:hypothetical protein OnM2_011012 [Erysiphe neolycopersici]
MGHRFKESNEISHLSQWKINRPGPRKYQTKQSKFKPTEDLSVTSYCGWDTTEDIFKSKGFPRTTIGIQARLNHELQSACLGKEFKIRLGALSTAISRSQVKHYFHHDKQITSCNNFYHDGSESTGILGNYEYHQGQNETFTTAGSSILIQDNPLLNTSIKVDRMDFSKISVNKVGLKESNGISTLTQPSSKLSISNPIVDKQAVQGNTVISIYLSGNRDKMKSFDLRGERQLNIDNDILEEESVSQELCGESFTPENSCFKEFDEGIEDGDFLAAEPSNLTPSDELLSIGKGSYSKLIQSPSLSAVSGKNLLVTYQIESKVDSYSIDGKILSFPNPNHENTPEKPVGIEISQKLLQENETCPINSIAENAYQNTLNLEKDLNESLVQSKKPKESKFQADLRACVGLDHITRTELQQRKLKPVPRPISKSFFDNQDRELASHPVASVQGDCYEFYDSDIFSRIKFPQLVNNDSPIIGLSSSNCLRTCFHIQEMINEAQRFMTLNTAPVIELFAHVHHSYRETNTTRQIFQFSDMWLDKPSFLNGILMNYKAARLIDEESQIFIDNDSKKQLARILATPKRIEEKGTMNRKTDTTISSSSSSSWLLHIISIRKTDLEEMNWTRRIVNAY